MSRIVDRLLDRLISFDWRSLRYYPLGRSHQMIVLTQEELQPLAG
ncbi:MAG: hypothetical protein VKL59_19535 [Nostocaceae cyanobacterium]|nr:hypothetical protein [Nostocaceae cyanobacterium]